MLDFLSNTNWLAPQIDFLLFLQGIRDLSAPIVNKFLLQVTVLGEYLIPTLVCSIIYWCIDTKNGIYMFTVVNVNVVITHLFKLLACVYRPWILSDKIHPPQEALGYARSYSFPSGHSANSSSIYGALAYVLKKHIYIVVFLILLILFIGFSRLWLGVHTPQDVIVGFSIGLILVFALSPVINWAEKNKDRYLYLLIIINLFTIASMIYIRYFNVYPADYIDGKLLVDPRDAIYVTLLLSGYVLGILNGAFLCRRFFPFEASEGKLSSRIIRGIIGVIFLCFIINYVFVYLFMHPLNVKFAIVTCAFAGFFITAIYPFIFSRILKL